MKLITELGESKKTMLAHHALNWKVFLRPTDTWINGKRIYCKNMIKKKNYILILVVPAKLMMEPDQKVIVTSEKDIMSNEGKNVSTEEVWS